MRSIEDRRSSQRDTPQAMPGRGEWDSISGTIDGTLKMTIVFRKAPEQKLTL